MDILGTLTFKIKNKIKEKKLFSHILLESILLHLPLLPLSKKKTKASSAVNKPQP